jgi:hypothetical protein
MGAFQNQVFQKGLDLRRSKIGDDLGTYITTDATTIRAGQFATYDVNGFVIPSTGSGVIGVFKWDKQQFGVSVNVDEAIVLNGTTPTNLKRPNVSNVAVRSAANFGGTLYTGGGVDYTVTAGAGQITRVALGAIPDGSTVFVTYTYQLTATDFQFDGNTFRNQNNDMVTGQEDRIAIITDWSRLFTMEYDTSQQYQTATSNFRLFCNANGQATSVAANDFVGRVHQLPTSDDPYLGMTIHGNPV